MTNNENKEITENTVATSNNSDTESTADAGQTAVHPERHHRRRQQDDKYFKIRNILNIIFMIGAVAGMAVYFFKDSVLGTIIILTAMAFKIAECCFRFIRQ